jgi:two-component system NtrC family sensor kinase
MRSNLNPYSALKRTILACMVLVPFIPFIVVLGIGYSYFRASIENSAIEGMKRTVDDHRQMIDIFLSERLADLDFIQRSHDFSQLIRPPALKQVFDHLGAASSAFIDLGVFDQNGLHIAYHGPYALTGKSYSDADWFREVMNKGIYISDMFLGYRQVPHFIIATSRASDRRRWVLRATIDSKFFNDLVENVRIGKTGEAYLLDTAGVLQTEHHAGGRLMEKDQNAAGAMPPRPGVQSFLAEDRTGRSFLYVTTWLQNKNWRLVVRQERSDAFRALQSATIRIVLISLVGGAAIIGTALYLTTFIVRRIQQADIEKERLGEQLIRAGRLAEIGEMATGFAHEINNPLQIIKSEQALVEMVMADLKEHGALEPSGDLEEVEDSLAQIRQQVDRCAAITQAILKFGRKGEPADARIDLRAFVPEVIEMVAKKASVQGITISRSISSNTPAVSVDPGQLQQVLLNMFNNALDAIIELHGNAGGTLSVSTCETAEGNAEIVIADNGCGVRPENMEKIFTPFFTTKPVGKGTGLGLSVCYGIVSKMGGEMSLESAPEKGTTFFIRLPAESQPKAGRT